MRERKGDHNNNRDVTVTKTVRRIVMRSSGELWSPISGSLRGNHLSVLPLLQISPF